MRPLDLPGVAAHLLHHPYGKLALFLLVIAVVGHAMRQDRYSVPFITSVILVVATHDAHRTADGVGASAAIWAIIVIQRLAERRSNRRRRITEQATKPMGKILGAPVIVRHVRIDKGRVTDIRVAYPTEAVDYTANLRDQMQTAMDTRMGGKTRCEWGEDNQRRFRVRRPQPGQLRVRLRHQTFTDHGGQVARAENIVQQRLGTQTAVVYPKFDKGKILDSFTVQYQTTYKVAEQSFRDELDFIVSKMLGRRYTSKWSTDRDEVRYSTAQLLPTKVAHTPSLLAKAGDTLIPFAVDAGNRPVAWELSADGPHCVLAGATGAGKSGCIRTLITGATARGIEVRICDVKQTSLLGFDVWPGVTGFATTLDEITQSILDVHEEMKRRNAAVKARETKASDLTPLILCIDETLETLTDLAAAHTAAGLKGTAPAVAAVKSIARLGRQSRVHLLAAFQRADVTKEFDGATRNNFGTRILLGKPKTSDAKRMLGIEADVTRDADGKIPQGRAIADTGRGDVEVQVLWTPPLDEYSDLSPADRAIVDALRPTPTAPRLVVPAQAEVHAVDVPEVPAEPVLTRPALRLLPGLAPVASDDYPNSAQAPESDVGTKRCPKCEVRLPLEAFAKDSTRGDGRASRCKSCKREDVRLSRTRTPVPQR